MSKYDEQKELYRAVISKEVCRVIKLKWKYPWLSKEYNQLEERNLRLRAIIKELDGD